MVARTPVIIDNYIHGHSVTSVPVILLGQNSCGFHS